MPRFRDENDFPDVETTFVDRREVSSEAVWNRQIGSMPVYDSGAESPRFFDKTAAPQANAVPSRKLEEPGEFDNPFVTVDRPDDDRRTILPRSNRWPSTLWGTSARMKVKGVWTPRFAAPMAVIPCIERVTRREVLFARRRAGGAASRRRKRRGPYSSLRC